jgi:hypothetical protein
MRFILKDGMERAEDAQDAKKSWGAGIHLMTTSEKEKTTQTSRGKKKADQTDEYNFFIASNENGTDEALTGESGTKELLRNGIIESKQNIDFFLPE